MILLFAALLSLPLLAGTPTQVSDISAQEKALGLTDAEAVGALIRLSDFHLGEDPEKALRYATQATVRAKAFESSLTGVKAGQAKARALVANSMPHQAIDVCRQTRKRINKGLSAVRLGEDPTPWTLLEAENWTIQGEAEELDDQLSESDQSYTKALELVHDLENATEEIGLLRKKAGIQLKIENYEESLELGLSALNLALESGDSREALITHLLIAQLQEQWGHSELALRHCREATDLALKGNHLDLQFQAVHIKWRVLHNSGHYSEALAHARDSLHLAKSTGLVEAAAKASQAMGLTFLALNRVEEGRAALRRGMELFTDQGDPVEAIQCSLSLARSFLAKDEFNEAEAILLAAEKTAQTRDLISERVEICSQLSHLYQGQGLYAKAIEQSQSANHLLQESAHRMTAAQMHKLKHRFDLDRSSQWVDSSDGESVAGGPFNYLILTSYFVVLVAVGVYSRYHRSSKLNKRLQQANQKINKQKDQLTDAFERMEQLAREDSLTGLLNRRAMTAEIERESSRAQRSQTPLSLVMIDIDDFKHLNDSFGHEFGDEVLKSCSDLLSRLLRRQDVAGRWGGDEFIVLLPETDQQGAERVAEKIGQVASRLDLCLKNNSTRLQLSLGVAELGSAADLEDCIHRADEAMYRQKRRKKTA